MRLPLYINARFLGKPITGTQRFAHEIIAALDKKIGEGAQVFSKVVLLAPSGTPQPTGLEPIGFQTCGHLQGHLWEQWDLWRASHDGLLLSLTNSGPVCHPRHLVVIHDALVYRLPENYAWAYRLFHQNLGRLLARRARVGTVSAFSASELAAVFHGQSSDYPVFYDGFDHILRLTEEPAILDRLNLRGKRFFLFVGSHVPNKNLARAIQAFMALKDDTLSFVIVGSTQSKVFAATQLQLPPTVLMPGRLTDGEIVALYRHAYALVFPSLYEGFGIPPLEALTLGCPVIASRIAPVQEVCGEAAKYFDPLDTADMAAQLRASLNDPAWRTACVAKGKQRLPNFTWRASAEKIWQELLFMKKD